MAGHGGSSERKGGERGEGGTARGAAGGAGGYQGERLPGLGPLVGALCSARFSVRGW
jgi:hypothetical protein